MPVRRLDLGSGIIAAPHLFYFREDAVSLLAEAEMRVAGLEAV